MWGQNSGYSGLHDDPSSGADVPTRDKIIGSSALRSLGAGSKLAPAQLRFLIGALAMALLWIR